MVLRAALTGHLVLSTLHTNTALGAVSRLINLGIPPFLVSSALIGSLGQRLVRKNCEQCLVEYQDSEGEGKRIGVNTTDKLFRGAGCEACRFTGYTSRIGIFELLTISPGLRALIEKGAPEELMGAELRSSAFMPMMEDGRSKILQGLTTLREVLKVTEAE
jgi:type II secretory ATPase GspE/PulE/Tfp pilus assembly ATPase PilB-like protein